MWEGLSGSWSSLPARYTCQPGQPVQRQTCSTQASSAASIESHLLVAAATLSIRATNAESVANWPCGGAVWVEVPRRLCARATEAAVAAVAPAPTSAAIWARVGFLEGPGILTPSSEACPGT